MILAFGHQRRTGKDTAATILIKHLRGMCPSMRIERVSFAYKLKLEAYEIFKWAGLQRPEFYELEENAHLRETVLPLLGKTPRQIWIEFGNKMREIHPDVWVRNAFDGTLADLQIVTDLRFMNEARVIESLGGYRYKMNRDVERGTDLAEVDLLDYTGWTKEIDNYGSLDDLDVKIFYVARQLTREFGAMPCLT